MEEACKDRDVKLMFYKEYVIIRVRCRWIEVLRCEQRFRNRHRFETSWRVTPTRAFRFTTRLGIRALNELEEDRKSVV